MVAPKKDGIGESPEQKSEMLAPNISAFCFLLSALS
jgi:hypothetical protein